MADFTALPIRNGYDKVHVNRFRICMRTQRKSSEIANIGAALMENMPKYMNKHTATVEIGSKNWGGRKTLKFRGVASISRPFSALTTLAIPGVPIPIPLPEKIRDWAMPDIHTDSVGAYVRNATGFTVQTLKREFEDEDDKKIRAAITALVDSVGVTAGFVSGGLLGAAAGYVLSDKVSEMLGDIAVDYNQSHFLAGRRAFRFSAGSDFGYDDGRVVFETAAIERYSNKVFYASQIAMGPIEDMVREVWGEMVTQVAAVHGMEVIAHEKSAKGKKSPNGKKSPTEGWGTWGKGVYYTQSRADLAVPGSVTGHGQYKTMSDLHQSIFEG